MLDTKTLLLLTLVWAVASYVIVPRLWMLYFRRHPFLVPAARLTRTGDGHPGDPVNIALVGSDVEVVRGLNAAGWFPADFRALARQAAMRPQSLIRLSFQEAR